MVLCGFGKLERILFHEANDMETQHFIDLTMSKDEATFMVSCCCDDEWFYEFDYNKSDYERIKYNILDVMFSCDNTEELLDVLDDIFMDGFEEIIVDCSADDYCDGQCCPGCDGCPREY